MNYSISMNKAVLSGLSVLLATLSLSPIAKAAEVVNKDSNSIHQLRLSEFDSRNKSFDIKDTDVHQLRLSELDSRNKNFDIKEDFSIHQLRLSEFDSRNKAGDSLSTVSLIEQRHLLIDRNSGK